jgi:hypothetical protein
VRLGEGKVGKCGRGKVWEGRGKVWEGCGREGKGGKVWRRGEGRCEVAPTRYQRISALRAIPSRSSTCSKCFHRNS